VNPYGAPRRGVGLQRGSQHDYSWTWRRFSFTVPTGGRDG
jgi:hypothetical protein